MLLTSWPRMLVFLRMTVEPNSLQACAKQLMSSCRASSVCAVRAASSTKSISLILQVQRSHDLEHASPGPEERAASMIFISLSLASKGTLNPGQIEPPLLLICYCILVKAN